MARARGSGLNALFKEESSYGVQPTGNWRQIQLFDHDVGEEQPLIESNILGQGREAQKPLQDIKTDEGGMNVPVDLRNFGFWLKMLLGAPTTTQIAATGTIVFPVNPSASDTITINGVVFTYVAASPTGNEILIGASLLDTLNNTQIALDASADMNVDDATYTDDNIDTLTITHDTPGPTGNLFTLAASAATVSAATLLGGAERHQFISGVTSLPSFAMEFGHPEVPQYLAHFGGRLNSMALNFQRSGAAQAALDLMFQKEKKFITSQGGTPT
ncbi:MAG: phage tail tube protein, partial [Candidatus Zixiibacteriota bacterium]